MTYCKNKLHLISLLIFLICICPVLSVFASGVDITCFQKDNTTMVVTIDADEGEYVTVNVLHSGKALSDINPYNVSEINVYQNQALTGSTGKVVFEIGLKKSGDYTVFYKVGDDSIRKKEISVINFDEQVSLLDDVLASDASEAEKLTAVADFYTDVSVTAALGLDKGELEGVDDEILFGYIINSILVSDKTDESAVRAKKAYNEGLVLAGVNEGLIDDVFTYDRYIDFENSVVSDWYDRSCVSEGIRKAVTEKISKEKPGNIPSLMEILTERLILEVVAEPDGVLNAKDIMNDFAYLIGIKPSESIDDYHKVAYKDHADLDDLKKAFEAESDNSGSLSSGSSGSSSSGGGGRGGKVSGGSISVAPSVITQPEPEKLPVQIYNDIDTAQWASEYIVALTEKNIVGGKGNGNFCPNDNITREEFTKMIVLAFAANADKADIGFTDVSEDDWYYDYVSRAYSSGIITGYDNGFFGVGDYITREDMAVIAFRASKKDASDSEIHFDDKDGISSYALEAVTILNELGIIAGYDNSFMPKENATRAQAAKIIYLLMQI